MQNFIIGALVVIVVLGGGYFLLNMNAVPGGSEATTTPQTTQYPTPSSAPSAGAPSVTTDTGVAPSNSTAVVSGKVTPNGARTAYWYEYGTTASLGSKTSNQNVGSGYVAIPAPGYITGLLKDTTYHFRLVAENQYGKVAGAQYTLRTTIDTPVPPGSAPTTKTTAAGGVERTSANLNGEVTPNQAATQYWFEYGKTAELGSVTALQSAGNGSAKISAAVSVSNLEPATTYYFRLNAQNQFGTVNGAILNFRTDGPPAANDPSVDTRTATSIGTSTATLRGSVDPNGAETTYWFEYSTDSLLGSVLIKATSKKSAGAGTNNVQVEANITGLNPDTTYYFRVVAENSEGLVRGDRETFKTD